MTLSGPPEEYSRLRTFAGRHETIEELGQGGMGTIFRVFDQKTQEDIAIKILNPEVSADKNTIARFRNELKLARRISYKNICRMFDLSESEGTYYIAMEYVPGENLKSIIRMTGQLSRGTALNIAKQVDEGLAEAHRRPRSF
jgi:serine/threonine protein kinase